MQVRGIDIRWNSVEDLGLSRTRAEAHGNSGGPGLEVVLGALSISPSDSILDIGCGKGGAMITLAKWPFQSVDGIELKPSLIQIAQRNLKRTNSVRGTIHLCDATEFVNFDPYTFLYAYNPFPEAVMKPVLENIRASLRRCPRPVTFIYKNPACHDAVLASGFRQVREFRHTIPIFRVYKA